MINSNLRKQVFLSTEIAELNKRKQASIICIQMKFFFSELSQFCIKQAQACLFGVLILGLLIGSSFIEFTHISRYDALFLGAILIQVTLMVFKLETTKETKIIFLFHLLATGMELFKTHDNIGAWIYPEANFFRIMNVPLFAGFMYSAVGSYLARSWRLFDFKFTHYPDFMTTFIVAVLIYINFFSHHFILDIRIALFAAIFWLYRKCFVHFRITEKTYKAPILIVFFFISILIWIAENAGTFFKVWLYPNQINEWSMVGFGKIGAWFLLMIFSFVLVSSLYRKTLKN